MSRSNFQDLVEDSATLSSVCAAFEKSESIALDTEYVREATYYPKPSLVQISDGKTHVLLDVLKLEDNLQPLQQLLAKPKITKTIHSFEQDLIMLEHIECPIKNSLFDTQLAAAFLGFGYMLSYQTLVKKCLGVQLEKGYARSNWLARPLSEQQINYALEDVIYLHQLYEYLVERLQQSGKLSWFEEENERMLEDYYVNSFIRSIPKVCGEGLLASGYEKNRLKILAKWREGKAMKADLPRRWLADDEDLIAVAQNQKSPSELIVICKENYKKRTETDSAEKGNYKKNFSIDVDELEEQLESISSDASNNNHLSKKDKQLIEKMKSLISETAENHEIEKSLIASHKEILRFVRNKGNRSNMALASGWRYRIMQQSLQKLMSDDDG